MTVHFVTGCISSDNTGCFPVMSNRGKAYVALFYIYNANAIWSVPIKNRSKEELLRGRHRCVRLANSLGILAPPPLNGQ
jgi:hypothetical protein